MGLLVGLTSWDGPLGGGGSQTAGPGECGKALPRMWCEMFFCPLLSDHYVATAGLSHKFMKVPSAGTCQDILGMWWMWAQGLPATAAQSWTVLSLWWMGATVTNLSVFSFVELLVWNFNLSMDFNKFPSCLCKECSPLYKYHLLPSVKDSVIALFGEDSCWFGEDSCCWYPAVGIHRLQKALFPCPWKFNSFFCWDVPLQLLSQDPSRKI